jgi:hypothetical protein
MWNSQCSPQLTTDRDQVFDEIVLIRIGHCDCQPLPPIDFRAVFEAPDKHSSNSDCRCADRGVDLISDALPFGRLWSRRIALESFLIAGSQMIRR